MGNPARRALSVYAEVVLLRQVAAAAVRATELTTEALVTQTQTTDDPAVQLRILAGIESLGATYHQLHVDLQASGAKIVAEIAALRAERQADREETGRQIAGLGQRIDRMQRRVDGRIDEVWREIDELKAREIPEDVRAKLVELEMILKDVLARLGVIEAAALLRRSTPETTAPAAPEEPPV